MSEIPTTQNIIPEIRNNFRFPIILLLAPPVLENLLEPSNVKTIKLPTQTPIKNIVVAVRGKRIIPGMSPSFAIFIEIIICLSPGLVFSY